MTTKIEWANDTWNPVTGCTKVSAGCDHCYAARMAKRLKGMGQAKYADGFEVRWHEEALAEPARWRKPRRVFVCSMGDLFHEDVPGAFIRAVFSAMGCAERHTFYVLTKRPEMVLEQAKWLIWPDNVWMGVTVENQDNISRLGTLGQIPAKRTFISCEPLLGPVYFPWAPWTPALVLPNWVIAGGESGPGACPMRLDWARGIRDQCKAVGVP